MEEKRRVCPWVSTKWLLAHVHAEMFNLYTTSFVCTDRRPLHPLLFCQGVLHRNAFDGPGSLDISLYNYRYGYVQVFLSDDWVPVGDSGGTWTVENSNVVCRQLGFDTNG